MATCGKPPPFRTRMAQGFMATVVPSAIHDALPQEAICRIRTLRVLTPHHQPPAIPQSRRRRLARYEYRPGANGYSGHGQYRSTAITGLAWAGMESLRHRNVDKDSDTDILWRNSNTACYGPI